MTERRREDLKEMRRRMEAAKDKPADIQHFFFALEAQPDEEADYRWATADKRLTAFENGVPDSEPAAANDKGHAARKHAQRRAFLLGKLKHKRRPLLNNRSLTLR